MIGRFGFIALSSCQSSETVGCGGKGISPLHTCSFCPISAIWGLCPSARSGEFSKKKAR